MSYELRSTQFSDPDQKSGQHTNGRENTFVREDDASPWFFVESRLSVSKVRNIIETEGFAGFTLRHCIQVGA